MTLSKDIVKAAQSSPTTEQYTNLQLAYSYFNKTLFNNELKPCLPVFGRDQKSCYGYFHAEQWQTPDGKDKCHMISLTPMHLKRPLEQTFGTLVHEMCHLWQQDFGEPSKGGYHNKEWADKMEEVGLMPSVTGEEGGKRTGAKVTHYIQVGGVFSEAFKNLPEDVKLPWIGSPGVLKEKKKRDKIAYQCMGCEAKCWGKPGLNITCNDCEEEFVEL